MSLGLGRVRGKKGHTCSHQALIARPDDGIPCSLHRPWQPPELAE